MGLVVVKVKVLLSKALVIVKVFEVVVVVEKEYEACLVVGWLCRVSAPGFTEGAPGAVKVCLYIATLWESLSRSFGGVNTNLSNGFMVHFPSD